MSEYDRIETRRYRVHYILSGGGDTPEQFKLYEAFEQALKESEESGNIQRFPLFRRTFELAGFSFPTGTSVALSDADSHLWIRHYAHTLDGLESRFSITPVKGGPDHDWTFTIAGGLYGIKGNDGKQLYSGFIAICYGRSNFRLDLPFSQTITIVSLSVLAIGATVRWFYCHHANPA